MEPLDLSQRDIPDGEIENRDSEKEIAVEFLDEVRVPCLICGVDLEIDNVAEPDHVQLSHDVFHGLLKWFKVEIEKKGKQRLADKGWDGEGGEILRFCGNCKMELKEVLELQKELEKLQNSIENRLGEVKLKMENFEGTFQTNGIYERDQRYKMLRNRILERETTENSGYNTQPNGSSEQLQGNDFLERRSSSRGLTERTSPPARKSSVQLNNKKRRKVIRETTQRNVTTSLGIKKNIVKGQLTIRKSASLKKRQLEKKMENRIRSGTSSKRYKRTAVKNRPRAVSKRSAGRPQRNIKKVNYAECVEDDDEEPLSGPVKKIGVKIPKTKVKNNEISGNPVKTRRKMRMKKAAGKKFRKLSVRSYDGNDVCQKAVTTVASINPKAGFTDSGTINWIHLQIR